MCEDPIEFDQIPEWCRPFVINVPTAESSVEYVLNGKAIMRVDILGCFGGTALLYASLRPYFWSLEELGGYFTHTTSETSTIFRAATLGYAVHNRAVEQRFTISCYDTDEQGNLEEVDTFAQQLALPSFIDPDGHIFLLERNVGLKCFLPKCGTRSSLFVSGEDTQFFCEKTLNSADYPGVALVESKLKVMATAHKTNTKAAFVAKYDQEGAEIPDPGTAGEASKAAAAAAAVKPEEDDEVGPTAEEARAMVVASLMADTQLFAETELGGAGSEHVVAFANGTYKCELTVHSRDGDVSFTITGVSRAFPDEVLRSQLLNNGVRANGTYYDFATHFYSVHTVVKRENKPDLNVLTNTALARTVMSLDTLRAWQTEYKKEFINDRTVFATAVMAAAQVNARPEAPLILAQLLDRGVGSMTVGANAEDTKVTLTAAQFGTLLNQLFSNI